MAHKPYPCECPAIAGDEVVDDQPLPSGCMELAKQNSPML
jgi:hypothetical protein